MERRKIDDSGIFPVIIIVALVAIALLIAALYFWPFYTIGALIFIATGYFFLTTGSPKVLAIGIAIGSALALYGYFWG